MRQASGARVRARTLSQTPGIGVYPALTAKLMTTRDPSRCSSARSRPGVPKVNTHREKREEQSKNPFENTSTLMYMVFFLGVLANGPLVRMQRWRGCRPPGALEISCPPLQPGPRRAATWAHATVGPGGLKSLLRTPRAQLLPTC